MNTSAIILLILAVVLVWGGLIASIMFVRARPNVTTWPPGGEDDDRDHDAPAPRDT